MCYSSKEDKFFRDTYYGVKNRLLGVCYDLRHAYMGDRDVVLVENGMTQEKMTWHNMQTPTKNVQYRVNIFLPEAIFLAAAVPEMYDHSLVNYGLRTEENTGLTYAHYIKDKANLDAFCAGIWTAVADIVEADEIRKLVMPSRYEDDYYADYAIQYVDKLNVELLKTPYEKRNRKVLSIAKRIVKKPQTYINMERDIKEAAVEYGVPVYEIYDSRVEYPEEFEW